MKIFPVAFATAAAFLAFGAKATARVSSGEPANVQAMLEVIGEGESSGNYWALAGGGEFSNFSDHPGVTGEFAGISTDTGDISYAAGKYQITRRTWLDLGGVDRYGDFSPEAQDAAAVDLLRRRGAYDLVIAGDIVGARARLVTEWEIFSKGWDAPRTVAAFLRYGGELS